MIQYKKIFYFLGIYLFRLWAANATILEYEIPEMLGRVNLFDGHNIPAMSLLNNPSPVINSRGDVSFKVLSVEGSKSQGLWFRSFSETVGKMIYIAPDERFITAPAINNEGKIIFNLYDQDVTDGLFILDTKINEVVQILNPDDQPILHYTYPWLLNNLDIYFRATDDNGDRSFLKYSNSSLTKIFTEGVESSGIKASYLFKPSVNQAGMITFKARLGEIGEWGEERPDALFLLAPNLKSTIGEMKITTIAHDLDRDPESPYQKLYNFISLSNKGEVAFIAQAKMGKKVISVYKDNLLNHFAIEGQNEIFEIELFNLKISESGTVLFRARNLSGKSGLYLADGVFVKRLIGEGDEVMTDQGLGLILDNPNYRGLEGDFDMNDKGEIVFHALIVSKDNEEWGSAIFKLTPKIVKY